LGIASAVIAAVATFSFLKRHHHSTQARSIRDLLESSQRHESAGRLTEALLDFDAALALARKPDGPSTGPLEKYRHRREDLAKRESQNVIEHLNRAGSTPFPLGDWLNLLARAQGDPDLKGLIPEIQNQFQASLDRSIAAQLASARKSMEAGRVGAALSTCDDIAILIKHVAPDTKARTSRDVEDLVSQLVIGHGVQIELPEGEFTFGSQAAYIREFVPILTRGLEAKGYLPYRESSPWKAVWNRATHRVHLKVIEQLEGNYLSSANRLTRIVADLTLSRSGELKWHTSPTARSTVPLPKLSALIAGRVAAAEKRSDEFERMLYADARSHIDEKVGFALSNMPPCPAPGRRG
jgi:hypothetical protein